MNPYPTGGWYGGVTYPTSTIGMPTAYNQFSFGGVLSDLGDWIKTTSGEILRVVVDQFGRRIVQKTGEILSTTPIGAATTYSYAGNTLSNPTVLIGIGVVALLLLGGRRR